MQQYGNGFAGRIPGESFRHTIFPELGAESADGRAGDGFGETSELEVQGTDRIVGVASRSWHELADKVRVIVALSINYQQVRKTRDKSTAIEIGIEVGIGTGIGTNLSWFTQYLRACSTSASVAIPRCRLGVLWRYAAPFRP